MRKPLLVVGVVSAFLLVAAAGPAATQAKRGRTAPPSVSVPSVVETGSSPSTPPAPSTFTSWSQCGSLQRGVRRWAQGGYVKPRQSLGN